MRTISIPSLLLTAAVLVAGPVGAQTIVCMETNFNSFCMELLEKEAPVATANFLTYVDGGAYNNTLIHQSVSGSYLGAGKWQVPVDDSTTLTMQAPAPIVTNPPIVNEYKLPNSRGTVAFVTAPGQPNSATSAFRINVTDNSAAFSAATSGAVFARVIGEGMTVVNYLSKLVVHAVNTGALAQAPLLKLDNRVTPDDLVQVKRLYRYAGTRADFDQYGVNFPPTSTNQPLYTDVTCFQTNLGELCMTLFPDVAPKTVENFLKYVNAGNYNGTVIHRSVANFVVQGGGYVFSDGTLNKIANYGTVVNEFSRPNKRGTIAMAKLGGDANSATSEWYFNIADNTVLDDTTNNGGYTVFGQVIDSDLPVLDLIASVRPLDLSTEISSAFNEVPLVNLDTTRSADDFITVQSAYVTRRDINEATNPLSSITALGNWALQTNGWGVRIPLRYAGKLYMITLGQDTENKLLFNTDLYTIISLKENGRVTATLDGDVLRIPMLRVQNTLYTNVVLTLVDKTKLQFRLDSYEAF